MPVVEVPCVLVGKRYWCDSCGRGEMFREGNSVLPTMPPKYPHKCGTCGAIVNLKEPFPTYSVTILSISDDKIREMVGEGGQINRTPARTVDLLGRDVETEPRENRDA